MSDEFDEAGYNKTENNDNAFFETDGLLSQEEHTENSDYYASESDISEEIKKELENSEPYKTAAEMTDEIIALTNRLDEQFKKNTATINNISIKKNKAQKYRAGSLSAALALIYAGITLIYGLSVPNGILLAFRFSPLILIFLGIEIILNIVINRYLWVKLDLYGFTLSTGIIIAAFITSLMYLNMTNTETTKEKTEKRLESEINHALTDEFITLNKLTKLAENEILIGNVETDVLIYGEDLYDYKNIYSIGENDTVNIKIYFNVAQKTLVSFAEDCVKTLEVLNEIDFFKKSSGNVEFIGADRGNYIHVKLNKKLQNNISAAEIAMLADYFAENLITDTEDLIYTEE